MDKDDTEKMWEMLKGEGGAIELPADARAAAVSLRQMYLAMTGEGFTPNQAMTLICTMLSASMT